jgi:GNAT superfamily N-acetyltransferase
MTTGTMLTINFSMSVLSDNCEPDQVIPAIHGDVLDADEDAGDGRKIGYIGVSLIQRGRAMNDGIDLDDALDCADGGCDEGFRVIFDCETQEWRPSLINLYGGEPPDHDVLFIECLELDPAFRGKGIGAQVVKTTIATFGSGCTLVACKPFLLQHGVRASEEAPEDPRAKKKRLADLAKVRKFWTGCGFRNVPGSEIFTRALWLKNQPPLAARSCRSDRSPHGHDK